MKVRELIEQLQKLPEYATVRVLKNDKVFLYRGKVERVELKSKDDDDEYLERYVDIK